MGKKDANTHITSKTKINKKDMKEKGRKITSKMAKEDCTNAISGITNEIFKSIEATFKKYNVSPGLCTLVINAEFDALQNTGDNDAPNGCIVAGHKNYEKGLPSGDELGRHVEALGELKSEINSNALSLMTKLLSSELDGCKNKELKKIGNMLLKSAKKALK
jgi:hypothetical protein